MALKVNIKNNRDVSLWRDYVVDGAKVAEFKIRGIAYKPYQVALERAAGQINSKGYDVTRASKDDRLYHELLFDAAACHLIEDWSGISFAEEIDNEMVEKEVGYSEENAIKLLGLGDIGTSIWLFVKTEAEKIQKDADQLKDETVGKSLNSTDTATSTQDSPTTKKRKEKL